MGWDQTFIEIFRGPLTSLTFSETLAKKVPSLPSFNVLFVVIPIYMIAYTIMFPFFVVFLPGNNNFAFIWCMYFLPFTLTEKNNTQMHTDAIDVQDLHNSLVLCLDGGG